MSRSNYTEDDGENNWGFICYRGAVASAIKGKRGQALLQDLAKALDAMPVKRLISDELEVAGEFCTLGVLGRARGIDMAEIDPTESCVIAKTFDIAEALAREIVFENDDRIGSHRWIEIEICGPMRPWYPERGGHHKSVLVELPADEVAAKRWVHMRKWVADNTVVPA